MTDGQQWVPLADWQRGVLDDVYRLREREQHFTHYRPRVMRGMGDLSPYREAMQRAISDLTDSPDQHALDPTPDRCWRCDALPASCDLGLCDPCRGSLT